MCRIFSDSNCICLILEHLLYKQGKHYIEIVIYACHVFLLGFNLRANRSTNPTNVLILNQSKKKKIIKKNSITSSSLNTCMSLCLHPHILSLLAFGVIPFRQSQRCPPTPPEPRQETSEEWGNKWNKKRHITQQPISHQRSGWGYSFWHWMENEALRYTNRVGAFA